MPTLRDVARAAAVSTTTASDALSGRGRLPEATRRRVAAVAAELGYTPNLTARNLRRGRTGAVGLLTPQHTAGLAYYMELAVGAVEAAHAQGVALTLLPAVEAPGNGLHVDGVIVADPALDDPVVRSLARAGLPVVTCERDPTPGAAHTGRVESDHVAVVTELLDHLAAAGARRLAVLLPGPETAYGQDAQLAHQRWCAQRSVPALAVEVGLTARPDRVRQAVTELLDAPEPPDALLAVPDGSAVTALQTVRARGVRVPEDLLFAAYAGGPAIEALDVTAVDLAPRQMGQQLVRLLLDVLADRRPAGTCEDLPLRVVQRASTTRPPRNP
ncbi:LacI family DNA-binding transcriptional regulator [Kineococcus rhizosphaerae]|uniref:LacI family transcriptional regulator n=1 Tax=Kineococcus rhizosphaerae TaxID=559628 RepID=A0A2T0QXF4_9ACTN|nr:LacI family DNA-binding transcriptional regulator [Kineococcus rhizosphaerae]PRY10573.1 LacI family transcriptional regulator [Kineococcus rhizosphaerae]